LQIPPEAYLSVSLDHIEPQSIFLSPPVEIKHAWKRTPNYKAILDAEMKEYYDHSCQLSKTLLKETRLYRESPNASAYAPYIRYLDDTQPIGQTPATYSLPGKELLRKIQGIPVAESGDHGKNTTTAAKIVSEYFGISPLPPEDLVDWIDTKYVQAGCIEADDLEAHRIVGLVIQRGFDLECIPLWVSISTLFHRMFC